jgi:hypothetical protein
VSRVGHRWVLADITYLNGQGATVNTAIVGDNQWLIDTVEYSYSRDGGGQVTSTLSAGNRAIALNDRDGCVAAGAPAVVCTQADSASRAIGLSTFTVYDPNNPGVVTDTYGPITNVVNAGTPVAARAHARTRYNEGVPANLVDTFAADGTFLPTSVTTSGWTPGIACNSANRIASATEAVPNRHPNRDVAPGATSRRTSSATASTIHETTSEV